MSSKRRKLRVETVKKKVKGKVYTSVLLRCSYRQDGKVKHETLGNLTQLPPDVIDFMKRRLSGELDENAPQSSFEIVRSLPHGNVLAVLQTAKKLGLENLLASRPCRERDLIMALIAARVLSPRSKLSTNTALNAETANHTLAEELELGEVDVHQLYVAMDWLVERQTRIENKLAKKHLKDGHLVLFDVSSSFYTGRKNPLIKHGYSRDHRRDRPQIVYGLLCDSDGRPIAIEVFPGNTADPPTFTQIVARARKRFGINRIVFVGDRGSCGKRARSRCRCSTSRIWQKLRPSISRTNGLLSAAIRRSPRNEFVSETSCSRQPKSSSSRFDSRLCVNAIHFVANGRLAFALAR
jgi:hypothetical protein